MPSQPELSLTRLLTSLAASGTEFLLVGGLAAVAQGATFATFDVDIVHRRTAETVDRLLAFLATVDGHYRGRPAGQVLRPARDALLGTGHHLLSTGLGPLDVLGAIEGGRDFESLAPETVTIQLGGNFIRVVRLQTLADLKRGSTSAKDRLVLEIIEALLDGSSGA